MLTEGGYKIVRAAEIPWEDRKNVDGWPSRAGKYYEDLENGLCMRLIDYPPGAIEPRHVHPGAHATTVLKGTVYVDGTTLNPLDVILGPSNEPHGPLSYPQGCKLFSAFLGSYFHNEATELSENKSYRLVKAQTIPWQNDAQSGAQLKTLIDHGVGRMLLQLLRFEPGASLAHSQMLGALVVQGSAVIGEVTLGEWDFLSAPPDAERAPISFPGGASLLAVTLQ